MVFFLVKCPSGLRSMPGKYVYWETGTDGSNPSFTAKNAANKMAPWRNWIAQLPSKQSVTCSNHVGVTNAPIAQLEEQGPSKAKVGGSSPFRCSNMALWRNWIAQLFPKESVGSSNLLKVTNNNMQVSAGLVGRIPTPRC